MQHSSHYHQSWGLDNYPLTGLLRSCPLGPSLCCRTVYDLASGEQMPRLVFSEVRGLEGVKEASVTIAANPAGPLSNTEPVQVNVAVANGLGNAKKLVKAVHEGTANYHFVEVRGGGRHGERVDHRGRVGGG
jgi:hypothetical protein